MSSYLSRTTKICLSLAVLAFLVVSIADAQPPQGRGQRQGRQGRGPGGGFGFRGGPINIFGLTANPEVQKELELTADQIEKAKKIQDAHREEARGGQRRGGFDRETFQNLSQEERRKFFENMQKERAEAQKKLNDKYLPQLAAELNEKQMARLEQIRLQASGPEVLRDPVVIKALGVTAEQREKLAALGREANEKRRELFQGFSDGDRQEIREKMQKLRDEGEAARMKVLTSEQRTKLVAMKGKPFEGAERLGRGGRRGGGRGGPGGGQDRPRRRPATE